MQSYPPNYGGRARQGPNDGMGGYERSHYAQPQGHGGAYPPFEGRLPYPSSQRSQRDEGHGMMHPPRNEFRSNVSGPFPPFKASERLRRNDVNRMADDVTQIYLSEKPVRGAASDTDAYHSSPRRRGPPPGHPQYYGSQPQMNGQGMPDERMQMRRHSPRHVMDDQQIRYGSRAPPQQYHEDSSHSARRRQPMPRPPFANQGDPVSRPRTAPIRERPLGPGPGMPPSSSARNLQAYGDDRQRLSPATRESFGDVLDAYYGEGTDNRGDRRPANGRRMEANGRPPPSGQRYSPEGPRVQQPPLPYPATSGQRNMAGPGGEYPVDRTSPTKFRRPSPNSNTAGGRERALEGAMQPVQRGGGRLAVDTNAQPFQAPTDPHNASPDALPRFPSPESMRDAMNSHQSSSTNPQQIPGRHEAPMMGSSIPQRQYGSPVSSQMPPLIRQSPSTDAFGAPKGPITLRELEALRNDAKRNPNDRGLHLTLAKRLIEAASVLADDDGRANPKAAKKNREAYITQSSKIIKKLTSSSNPYPEAMFFYATCCGNGNLGTEVDHQKAFSLYQSAAKLNHAPSAYRTAVCCELGAGTKKEPTKAVQWYKKAAVMGDTAAMFKLGMIYLRGLLGQHRSPKDGLTWLKRSAEQADTENPHALHELGLLYSAENTQEVVIQDDEYALELFSKAAALNYPASQFRLGCCYEYGTLGCTVDARKSVAWYSRAAELGDAESELVLGGWYLTGASSPEGVILQQSDSEAFLWTRRAAEKGLAKAEYALGYFSEVGIGVTADLEQAKRYYLLAAGQQHPKAMQRLQELRGNKKPGFKDKAGTAF